MSPPQKELSVRPSGVARSEQGEQRAPEFNVSLAYLRTFVIVLVVAHHATMAYNVVLTEPVASSLSQHLQSMRAISSVIDAERSPALSLFAAFNDNFFMPLLFLVSGLFVLNSLRRRGRLVRRGNRVRARPRRRP